MDALLADLGLDLDARLAAMRRTRKHWGERMHVNADVRHDLARKYRAMQGDLVPLLERRFDSTPPMAAVADVLEVRSRRQREIVTRLTALDQDQQLGVPLFILADSYAHMHLNRLFRAEPNLHEVVIYDFLVQLYARQLARAKHAGRAG